MERVRFGWAQLQLFAGTLSRKSKKGERLSLASLEREPAELGELRAPTRQPQGGTRRGQRQAPLPPHWASCGRREASCGSRAPQTPLLHWDSPRPPNDAPKVLARRVQRASNGGVWRAPARDCIKRWEVRVRLRWQACRAGQSGRLLSLPAGQCGLQVGAF